MSITERIAYSRGMEKYLPQILFGADAPKPDDAKESKQLSAIPGVQIVKAY